jgi:DNA-binding beta-propeller fold protein YncE
MQLVVSSAGGANGNGYDTLLAFDLGGRKLGVFGDDPRIGDPRGLSVDSVERLLFVNSGRDRVLALDFSGRIVRDTGPIAGLNPGGGLLGPDGRYYVGSRSSRTILAFSKDLITPGAPILPSGVVPFPRGFTFSPDGRVLLASGVGPHGEGDNSIALFDREGTFARSPLIDDLELSPLDLLRSPSGTILVSSEYPFGALDAVTTIREYDMRRGSLIRVFSPDKGVSFRKPRGLRFGPEGNLCCVSEDTVVCFDFQGGKCLGTLLHHPRLNGQALEFVP